MKKFSILFFFFAIFSNTIYSQCINADFSSGDLSYWDGSTGENSGGDYSSIVAGLVQGTTNSGPTDPGRQTIINAAGTDPNTGGALSVLPPGGTSCCRLGNSNTNYEAERISYNIAVNSSNCIFTYQYAVVLQDPGSSHTTAEMPKFTIYVKNSAGNVVDPVCGIYEVSASASIPGFNNYNDIRWKDWTSVGIDLSTYIGQTITVEFTTYDCAQGAHYGYAYITCHCGALQLAQQCMGSSSLVTAPAGFASYSWSVAGTGQSVTINNPVNGALVYCTVTSVQGCSLTLQTTLSNQPAVFTLNSATVCEGQPATITATGTNTYAWSNGGAGSSITVTPTTTTTYTVTATAAGGCTNSDVTTVTVNALPVPDPGPDLTICPGSSATLDASASTGNPPLTYAWNNGINTVSQSVSPATTTTYTVTVTSNNCSASEPITVNVVNNLVVAATPITSSICLGGSVPLTASGATNYTWSPATGLSSTTGANVTATPTTTTTYTVVGSSGTCSGSTTVTVNVNNISVSVTPSNPTICSGNSVTLTATGGTNFTWSPSTGLSSTTVASVVANPTATTTYNVDISDANGCSATASATVNVVTVTATATSTDENCGQSNGSATVTPTGNCTQTLTYLWNSSPFQQTTVTATNLPGGTYTVTVSCGACSATASAVVMNLAGPSVSIITITNTTCSYNNGGAVAQASGGTTTTYNYNWSNGQSGSTLSNVYDGAYTVTVTDGVGCTAVNNVNITDTPGPTATITGIDFASCGTSDGGATLTVTGGAQPYTFQWGPNGQSTQNLTGIPTGNYNVTVMDNNGCTTSTQVFIGEDPGPTASVLSENEICDQANGTATVNATGGLGVYTYLWSDSNGQTTSTATGLAAGTYTVIVSDGGCSTTQTVNVMETPGPNAGFSANPQVLTIMDGPVSFLDNSSGNVVNWAWTLGDGSLGNGESFDHQYTNIGTYLVTLIITDNNGCQDTTIDTIKVKDIYTLYIPNVFTPNGDGINDYFFPQGVSVDPDNFDMYIFDRWGNMMFHTSKWLADINRSEGWNGTQDNNGTYNEVVMDVYVYRILTKEVMGPKHEYIGRVALIP
jgi:trimeric autotransporter adhesin